ncbi:Hypothetical protein NTJ_11775 [Nesidiocoris tenuis]|uniref:Uncharacterized protein n=1 Tax=Nesidiocoris tenuis TaxID=355587 RepID=A0ABN7B544_9HEMI|nr:Hypothetical protein NTJ_11775 [Nesidiocoris tenuis]
MADRGDRCNRRPGRRATGRDPNGWTPPDNSRTPSPLGVPLSPDNEDLAQMLAAQPRNRQPSRSPSPSPQASHLCPARSQSPRRATPPGDWTPPAVQFQPGSPLAYGLLPSPENARDYGQRPPSRSPPRPDFGQCGPPRTTPPPQSPAGQCNADYFNLSGPGWEPPRWDSPLEDSTPSPSPTAQRQTRRRIAFTSSPAVGGFNPDTESSNASVDVAVSSSKRTQATIIYTESSRHVSSSDVSRS